MVETSSVDSASFELEFDVEAPPLSDWRVEDDVPPCPGWLVEFNGVHHTPRLNVCRDEIPCAWFCEWESGLRSRVNGLPDGWPADLKLAIATLGISSQSRNSTTLCLIQRCRPVLHVFTASSISNDRHPMGGDHIK